MDIIPTAEPNRPTAPRSEPKERASPRERETGFARHLEKRTETGEPAARRTANAAGTPASNEEIDQDSAPIKEALEMSGDAPPDPTFAIPPDTPVVVLLAPPTNLPAIATTEEDLARSAAGLPVATARPLPIPPASTPLPPEAEMIELAGELAPKSSAAEGLVARRRVDEAARGPLLVTAKPAQIVLPSPGKTLAEPLILPPATPPAEQALAARANGIGMATLMQETRAALSSELPSGETSGLRGAEPVTPQTHVLPQAQAREQAQIAARHLALHVPAQEQVALHIVRAAREGIDHIRIQLDPADLGRIDVRLEIGHDGRVIAALAADRQETLDLLQRDARALERALHEAGLRPDSDSLNFSLRQHGGDPRRQSAESGHGPAEAGEREAALARAEAGNFGARNRSASGRIDINV